MKIPDPQKHSDATSEQFGTLASGVSHQPQTQAFLSRFCPVASAMQSCETKSRMKSLGLRLVFRARFEASVVNTNLDGFKE